MVSALATAGLLALTHVAPPAPSFTTAQPLRDTLVTRDEWFGAAVAISGDTAIVGGPRWRYDLQSDGGADFRWGHLIVYVRRAGRWVQQADLYAPHAGHAAMDKPQFARSVALAGDTLVVGVPEADFGTLNLGMGYVFARSGNTWSHQTTLMPSGTDNSNFGDAVAIWGDTIVMGGPRSDGTGKICTFKRSGTAWPIEVCKYGTTAGERYGEAVAIHKDLMVVGAPDRTVATRARQGAVEVYKRSGGTWNYAQTITLVDGAVDDQFGETIALSGNVALIGAPSGVGGTGKVHIFDIDDATGLLKRTGAQIPSPSPQVGARFGASISLAADRVAIGAPYEDVDARVDQGAMYVYQRVAQDNTSYSSGTRLVAADGSAGDLFGFAVGVSGNAVIVGAAQDDVGTPVTVNKGSAYVYNSDLADSGFVPDAVVADSNGRAQANGGESIAVAKSVVVVGAPDSENPTGKGEVLVMGRDLPSDAPGGPPGTSPGRTVLARLSLGNAGVIGDKFGAAVDVTPDGATIVVGIPGRQGGAGSIAVFRRPTNGWGTAAPTMEQLTAPSVPNIVANKFGESVAISPSGTIAVGAPDTAVAGAARAGAAFVFASAPGNHTATPAVLVSDAPLTEGRFGEALDASDRRVAVGEPFDEEPSPAHAGRLHVFDTTTAAKSAGKVLRPKSTVMFSKGATDIGNKFGARVSIEGTTVVAGAPGAGGTPGGGTVPPGGGAIYDVAGATPRLLASLDTGAEAGERAGSAVAITVDPKTFDAYVVLGASSSQRDQADQTGSAYLYVIRQGRYGDEDLLPAGELATGRVDALQNHGAAIAIDAHGLAIGVPRRDAFPVGGATRPQQGGIETYAFAALLRDGFE